MEAASRAASSLPLKPHARNRARAQESVVRACLELGEREMALVVAAGIEDWRRGLCHALVGAADLAQGEEELAQEQLALAMEVAEETSEDNREDLVAEIVRLRVAIGGLQEAASMAAELDEHEAGAHRAALALRDAREDASAALPQVEALLAEESFDTKLAGVNAAMEIAGSASTTAEDRDALEQRVRAATETFPLVVRLSVLRDLASASIRRGDTAHALVLLGEADDLLDMATWQPESFVEEAALLARARHEAGDTAGARERLDAAIARYDAHRDAIVDIWRAGALRPVAECLAAMGDEDEARAMWLRALDEGALNPNSRPRAEDLVATTLSIARMGVDPGDEIRARVEDIQSRLGTPW
jgi:hypothetical protein